MRHVYGAICVALFYNNPGKAWGLLFRTFQLKGYKIKKQSSGDEDQSKIPGQYNTNKSKNKTSKIRKKTKFLRKP